MANQQLQFGFKIGPLPVSEDRINGSEILDEKKNQQENDCSDVELEIVKLKKRNKCIVFCNHKFENGDDLPGYKQDIENIEETFKLFNFDFVLNENLAFKEANETFRGLESTNYSADECIMIFILSHGSHDGIIECSDNKLIKLDLPMECLNSNESLNGKPKLVFIQTCRGRMEETEVQILPVTKGNKKKGIGLGIFSFIDVYKDEPADSNNVGKKINIRVEHDLTARNANSMIFYSTQEGMKSWVPSNTGSIFIQSVCNVFRAHGAKYSLSNLIIMINNKVCRTMYEDGCETLVEACQVTHSLTCDINFSTEDVLHSMYGVGSYSKIEQTETKDCTQNPCDETIVTKAIKEPDMPLIPATLSNSDTDDRDDKPVVESCHNDMSPKRNRFSDRDFFIFPAAGWYTIIFLYLFIVAVVCFTELIVAVYLVYFIVRQFGDVILPYVIS